MASSILSFFKQTHYPTAVEHSIYCNFYHVREKNLVVASTTILRVFRLTPDVDTTASTQDLKLKLECVQAFTLFGNIMSVQAIRLSGSPRDALLLSFKEAKMSVVEYDPSTHDLKNLSLHFFEEEEMKMGSTQHPFIPLLRVDPDGRCAAMIVYERNIVILPFRKDNIAEDPDFVSGSSVSGGVKSPVLASYTIKLADIDEKVNNIKDLQFLQGYYEPTLLILYEPLRTWSGRVAVRQDTCAILALSLNINQKVHPVIWSVSSLPYDCLYTMPVPKPIGGILVVAVNSLLYLNQSVPPYGVSLNGFTDFGTSFPLKPQEGIKTTLDCSTACFITYDKLVMSLKGGELYVLTLFNDGMRSVRSFNFDRAASSVLTTCMTLCEDGYLFLGSRIGNSLLLRYTEKFDVAQNKNEGSENNQDEGTSEERPTKRLRQDDVGDWIASDVALIEDPDELEVYGNEMHTTKMLTSYTFEVCDSLLNIGPCGKICMGEPAFLSEEFSNNKDPDLELVTTSGYGKNGALSVLQRSIRPQVVTTFHLPGCTDMWTVVTHGTDEQAALEKSLATGTLEEVDSEKPEDDAAKQALLNTHSFLILSRLDSSMILQTGQEINELDHSGFSTQAPTVFSGNIGNNQFIVQVSTMGVRLLSGSRQLQHIPLDVGSPIIWASLADPYIIIMSAAGLVIQLTLKAADETYSVNPRLAVSKPQLAQVKSHVLTLCAYKDKSGIFTTVSKNDGWEVNRAAPIEVTTTPEVSGAVRIPQAVDDEDALLYGDAAARARKEKMEVHQLQIKKPKVKYEIKDPPASFWLFIVRENGVLEVYSLPSYRLCYLVKNFPMGQKFLVDSGQVTSTIAGLLSTEKSDKQHEYLPMTQEILVVGLGHRNSRPLLLARVDDDLLIYEAFPYTESGSPNHLKLRFRKMNHEVILRERKFKSKRSEEEEISANLRRLRYFDDISGYSGVFICGNCPYWLFLTGHGELRIHPMSIDGAITCFAPFHNVNCPKGFLYFNKEGHLRICVLPTHLNYDAPWPVRKVPLRCTPHFINYHYETKTYFVVTSNMETYTKLVKFNGDEKELEPIERTDERYMFPQTERFNLQLFSPVSWEVIPNTLIEMEEWEHIMCVKNVLLLSEGTRSGLKGYVAMGTNYNYGEDVSSRGRILILDIIEVVPEPGQPLTKNKIKVVYSKEQKGPVTAICQVSGFLLSAIGQKIYIWQLKDNDLIGVAFIDTQIYIHSVISIKNLIIVADISKSISLLRYQEGSRTLSLVSRDVKLMDVYSTEFLIDNSQVGFLVSDAEKNLFLFMYYPEARESFGGLKLLKKADFHVGHNILSFFRIRCRLGDLPENDKRIVSNLERKHITMFAHLDGGLGYLLPVQEKTYKRLLMLQNMLFTQIPHTAGLNPKAYRQVKSHKKTLQNPHKNILDGDLLYKYINLSVMEKTELAKRIGTSSDQIIDDLLEVSQCTAYF